MSVILFVNSTHFTVVLTFLAVACGSYTDVDVNLTNLVSQRHEARPNRAAGPVIPIEHSSDHVSEGHNIDWSSIPPTPGRHWNSWVDCGFYTRNLSDERIVHNLEHWKIVISYNLANRAEVTELHDSLDSMVLFEN